jgi:predicted nucleic acid-binding protein
MILADTSVWIDHFHRSDQRLQELLDHDEVLMHPFVVGELALGHFRERELILSSLVAMPSIHIADPEEILLFIEQRQLVAIGYVDVHLLASVMTTKSCRLWTRDKRLGAVATRLKIAAGPIN